MAALKLKALQNQCYDDFWSFLCDSSSEELLSENMYNKLKKIGLKDEELYAFLDVIFKEREREVSIIKKYQRAIGFGNSLKDANSMLSLINPHNTENYLGYPLLNKALGTMFSDYRESSVFSTICGLQGAKEKGNYLENEASYKRAQDIIGQAKLTHVKSDISQLKNVLDSNNYSNNPNFNGFSSIYLSNIPEYVDAQSFLYTVDTQLMPLIQNKGLLSFCCQGTDKQSLLMSDTHLNELKNKATVLKRGSIINPFVYYQKINSVEIFRMLNDNYDIDIVEEDTLASVNGFDSKDIYVYVKK